jgi:hypothetical protein
LNPYLYVAGNPLRYVDLFGLYECACIALGPTGKAPDTGLNYDKSGRKWCTYSCRRSDTRETKDVNAPGYGEFCIGQSGGDEYSPKVNFDYFSHDTESWIDSLPLEPFTNGPEFDDAIRGTFGDK